MDDFVARTIAIATIAASCVASGDCAAADRPVALGFAVEHSALDNGTPDWDIATLRLVDVGPDDATWIALGSEDRFGLQDLTLALGSAWRPRDGTRIETDLGGSPTCDVAACFTARFAVAQRIAQGLELHAGARLTDYDIDQARVFDLGAEWYTGNERFAYTAFLGQLEVGPTATSHFVQWDHYFGDVASVGAFLVEGDEVTRIDPATVVASPISAWGLRAKLPLGSRVVLELGLEHYQQGPYYDRDAVRAGLRYAL